VAQGGKDTDRDAAKEPGFLGGLAKKKSGVRTCTATEKFRGTGAPKPNQSQFPAGEGLRKKEVRRRYGKLGGKETEEPVPKAHAKGNKSIGHAFRGNSTGVGAIQYSHGESEILTLWLGLGGVGKKVRQRGLAPKDLLQRSQPSKGQTRDEELTAARGGGRQLTHQASLREKQNKGKNFSGRENRNEAVTSTGENGIGQVPKGGRDCGECKRINLL